VSPIVLDELTAAQEQSWKGLLELSARVPAGWCLIGGQMVFLLCRERGAWPARPTEDADAALDVRAQPAIVATVTRSLAECGFTSAGESREGHQQRWIRGAARIDLVIASGVGERSRRRQGVTGGSVPEAPGAQGALDRAERVEVSVGDLEGAVWRPSLLGAIAMKAAAYVQPAGRDRARHLTDVAVLATLLEPSDVRGFAASSRETARIASVLGAVAKEPSLVSSVTGAREGLERLKLGLGL
jgi:hypothetical protein